MERKFPCATYGLNMRATRYRVALGSNSEDLTQHSRSSGGDSSLVGRVPASSFDLFHDLREVVTLWLLHGRKLLQSFEPIQP